MRSSTMLSGLDPELIRGLPVHICLGHGVGHWARQVIPMPTAEMLWLGLLVNLFVNVIRIPQIFFFGGGEDGALMCNYLVCMVDLSLFLTKMRLLFLFECDNIHWIDFCLPVSCALIFTNETVQLVRKKGQQLLGKDRIHTAGFKK